MSVSLSGRSRRSRIGRGVLLGLAVLSIAVQGALISTAGWAATNPRTVSDLVAYWQYRPTPAVAGYVSRAAMSEHGRFLFYASQPRVLPKGDFDRVCSREEQGIGVLGCYTLTDRRIHLYDVTNLDLRDAEVVVAAHELLHAAWDRLSADERAALAGPLEEAFAALPADSELVQRIATYERSDPASRIPELYAIVGTELAQIPDVLDAHYARYFDDRQRVVALWGTVQAIFLELEAELESLSAEVSRLADEIEAAQAAAEQVAAELEADIAAFNERAERPGGYTSQSTFERDRQALLDRQTALTRMIDETNASIDTYNALVERFTALNAEAAALGKDLNIDPQPLQPSASP